MVSALFLFVGPVAATGVADDGDLRDAWADAGEDLITLTSRSLAVSMVFLLWVCNSLAAIIPVGKQGTQEES